MCRAVSSLLLSCRLLVLPLSPGTLDYMSPEVLRCPPKQHPLDYKYCRTLQYDASVDVWAVGVLAYELLVGLPPFASNSAGDAVDKIMAGQVLFPKSITPTARSFVEEALQVHPGDRPTVAQMAASAWLTPVHQVGRAGRDGLSGLLVEKHGCKACLRHCAARMS